MRGLLGGQDVVGSGTFVAVGDSAAFAKEEGAVGGQAGEPPVRIADDDLHMFRGILVAGFGKLFAIGAIDDFAVIVPGRQRHVGVGHVRAQLGDEPQHLFSQFL